MNSKISRVPVSRSSRSEWLGKASAPRRLATVFLGAFVFVATLAAGPPVMAPAHIHLTPDLLKTVVASGPAHDKLVSQALSAPGAVTDEYTPAPSDEPSVGETDIDISPMLASQSETLTSLLQPSKAQQCAAGTIAPQIFKAKGKLTSGGYLVLEGACFGNNGTVELGGFPNGDPHATNEAWTPTAITVQLPNISGVPDLTMHIQVKRTLASKVFDAKYTAATGDPVDLPAIDIKNNECASAGICIFGNPSLGIHADSTNTTGADVWTLKVPDHWHLHAIKLTHVTSGHVSTSTINATGSSKTIEISWAEHATTVGVPVTTTHTSSSGGSWDSIFEDVVTGGAAAAANSGSTTTTTTTIEPVTVYTEAYRFEATVRGPAGMKP
jgi:hypothetical protein